MARTSVSTPAQYLAALPLERRKVIAAVRKVILANLPAGYRESVNWGMLSHEIPLERYPDTFNGQPLMYAALAVGDAVRLREVARPLEKRLGLHA